MVAGTIPIPADKVDMLAYMFIGLFVLWLFLRKTPRAKLGADFIVPDPPHRTGGAFRGGTHPVRPPWEVDPAPSSPPQPLPPYDQHTICAKCGFVGAETTYRPYSQDFKFLPPAPGPNRRRWSWEHMERKCRGCGYVWAEAPVKADLAGGAA